MSNKENIVVYCNQCKNFYVITPPAEETQVVPDKRSKPAITGEEVVPKEEKKYIYAQSVIQKQWFTKARFAQSVKRGRLDVSLLVYGIEKMGKIGPIVHFC